MKPSSKAFTPLLAVALALSLNGPAMAKITPVAGDPVQNFIRRNLPVLDWGTATPAPTKGDQAAPTDKTESLPVLPPELKPLVFRGQPLLWMSDTEEFGAEERVNLALERLESLADQHATRVRVSRRNSHYVLRAGGRTLMTITGNDAALNHATEEDLADQWAVQLHDALERANFEATPDFWSQALRQALWATGIVTLLHFLLLALYGIWVKPSRKAAAKAAADAAAAEGHASPEAMVPDAHSPAEEIAATAAQLHAQADPVEMGPPLVDGTMISRPEQDNLGLLSFLRRESRWPLYLLLTLLWGAYTFYLMDLTPYTRPVLGLLEVGFAPRLMRMLGMILLAFVSYRISRFLIDAFLARMRRSEPIFVLRQARVQQRMETLGSLLKTTIGALIAINLILVFLADFGVALGPILASAGLIGIIVGFGAQSFAKDMIAGLFILLEDQYGVGDVIEVNGSNGLVETLGLRMTQMRNNEGSLITVPNGEIRMVRNLTNEWSQIDFKVPISYDSDVDKALKLLSKTVKQLQKEWAADFIGEPELLGVEAFENTGLVLRMWIKTRPLAQWAVRRELNLRVKKAFDKAGIVISAAQMVIHVPEKAEKADTEGL